MVQKNCVKNKILIICGPTASGKSALALSCARLLNSEIIYADSLDIYKGLDIGTAKPTAEEMGEIKHYMIDVVEPEKEFSVGEYKSIAEPILQDIISRGKIPVICGGTGFYINSLLYDLSYGNGKGNLEVREKYMTMSKEKGNEYVYEILKEKDPESAEKIHFNDIKRVIRALEIYESGVKKSDIKDNLEAKYDYKAYSIKYDRDLLYERINERVDKMIESGLVSEVKGLIDRGITINNQCMQGIGYKEIYSYLNGEIQLYDAIEQIKLNTRHYAKRQITFFKRLDNLTELSPDNPEILAKRIVDSL